MSLGTGFLTLIFAFFNMVESMQYRVSHLTLDNIMPLNRFFFFELNFFQSLISFIPGQDREVIIHFTSLQQFKSFKKKEPLDPKKFRV